MTNIYSSFREACKDITDWLWSEHPKYNGWRIRSFSWEYDLGTLPIVLYSEINDELEDGRDITVEFIEKHIERVIPPEGYAYVTLQSGNERVGFNVPTYVFQKGKS